MAVSLVIDTFGQAPNPSLNFARRTTHLAHTREGSAAHMSTVFVDAAMTELGGRMRRSEGARAAVRLLRADHLIEQHARGDKLVRRQDLPETAFYDGPIGANSGVVFVAIS